MCFSEVYIYRSRAPSIEIIHHPAPAYHIELEHPLSKSSVTHYQRLLPSLSSKAPLTVSFIMPPKEIPLAPYECMLFTKLQEHLLEQEKATNQKMGVDILIGSYKEPSDPQGQASGTPEEPSDKLKTETREQYEDHKRHSVKLGKRIDVLQVKVSLRLSNLMPAEG